MKQLSKYLAEKLIVNQNYKGIRADEQNYDPEELTSYILEHFEILPDSQTTNLSRLNKISSDEYDDLHEKLHHVVVDKFDFVNYKNITFLADARCIELLDDDLQNSYNESSKTIRIFYYNAINTITLVCDINI